MNLDQEMETIGEYCRKLIEEDGVQPCDICLVYNGSNIRRRLETQVAPMLESLGVELSIQTNKPFSRSPRMLLATNGEVVAQPLFWLKAGDAKYARFGAEAPRQRVLQRLEDFGVKVLNVGRALPGGDPPRNAL